MKIKSIAIKNFRVFVGENKINFSTDGHQGITVIHGETGSGKTSILNAFKWGFYGHTDFDTKEKNILNEHAITKVNTGDRISLGVIIEFEHEGFNYTAKREQGFTKVGGLEVNPVGGSVLELTWITPDGSFAKSPNAENQINQILPEMMHSYFFFNGERIEKLANPSASKEIRNAIKTLMGLEIVERATKHLSNQVVKTFKRELQEQSEGELDDIIDKENQIQDEIEEISNSITVNNSNIIQYEEEVKTIGTQLASIKESSELQKERDQIDTRLDNIKEELDGNSQKIRDIISERGFIAFVEGVSEKVISILEEKRNKGDIPYKIKQQFINDLLAEESCICGRHLHPGEAPYLAVKSFKKNAAPEGVEEALSVTSADLKMIDRVRTDMFKAIKDLNLLNSNLSRERGKLNGRLDVISSKILSDVEDPQKLETKRIEFKGLHDEALTKKGEFNLKLQELKKDAESLRKDREELSAKSEKEKVARKKLETAEELARVIGSVHEALSNQTREKLSSRVNETFQKIILADYWAEIDPNYNLQIFKNIPGYGQQPVSEKSTGQSQITSLSFIGSIVSIAKQQHEDGAQYFKGGVFPIVMDSPYGSLDDASKELVASYIPKLADQVILMATSSQWKGPVEKGCLPYVGKQFSLIYHAPKVKRESHYARSGADHEHTEIEEGYYG